MGSSGDEPKEEDLFSAALEYAFKRRLISEEQKTSIRMDHCRLMENTYVLADEQGHALARVPMEEVRLCTVTREPRGGEPTNSEYSDASPQAVAGGMSFRGRWVRAHSKAGLWAWIPLMLLSAPFFRLGNETTTYLFRMIDMTPLVMGLSALPGWLIYRRCPDIAMSLAGTPQRFCLWLFLDAAGFYWLSRAPIILSFSFGGGGAPGTGFLGFLLLFLLASGGTALGMGAVIGLLQSWAGLQRSLRWRWILASSLS